MKLFLVLLALFLPTSLSAHTIEPCRCDDGCYTKEVTNVSCTSGKAKFKSHGLPDASEPMMTGIRASNQQFPSTHNYEFEITNNPQYQQTTTPTEAGAIGVAVNGIPLFNPDTQGPAGGASGKRPSAFDQGELDTCGGHAGRGDDYHYHVAPKCLIETLGAVRVEEEKKPIGFAMDGFPILALGWFNPSNKVEGLLDECRGMKDDQGQYFYNVKNAPKWDILNCLHGRPNRFARDHWRERKDKNNREIVGIPIKFKIEDHKTMNAGQSVCHSMTGVLSNEQLLKTNGQALKVNRRTGSIFHCNSGCYGLFFEAERKPQFRGRVLYYDLVSDQCPAGFDISELKPFEGYKGPPQKHKGPAPTGKKPPRGGKGGRPPPPGGEPPPRPN